VCERALRADHPLTDVSAAWLAGFVSAGLATVGTGLALALPVRALGPLLRVAGKPLAAGIGAGVAAWAMGFVTQTAGNALTGLTIRAAAPLVSMFAGADLTYDPANQLLGADEFVVEISPLCSGAEGVGLMLVLVGAYVVRFRRELRFGRALWLLPLSVVLAYATNVLRIAALVWVGARQSPEVAIGGFHSKAGWVLFCALAIGLLTWVRRSSWFTRASNVPPADPGDNPTLPYLAPLLTGLALSLVTGLFSDGFETLYPVRVIGVAAVLMAVRGQLPPPRWSFSPVPLVGGALVVVVWLLLARPAPPDVVAQASTRLAGLGLLGQLWLAARVVGHVVVVPLAEELAFRGFVLRRLLRADFWEVDLQTAARHPGALLGSAILFGLLHQSMVAGVLAGIVYGLVVAWRGRLADAVIAHGATNAALAALSIVRGDYAWLL
jgi:exosortase E/protease (VPEID-CTERM system)